MHSYSFWFSLVNPVINHPFQRFNQAPRLSFKNYCLLLYMCFVGPLRRHICSILQRVDLLPRCVTSALRPADISAYSLGPRRSI